MSQTTIIDAAIESQPSTAGLSKNATSNFQLKLAKNVPSLNILGGKSVLKTLIFTKTSTSTQGGSYVIYTISEKETSENLWQSQLQQAPGMSGIQPQTLLGDFNYTLGPESPFPNAILQMKGVSISNTSNLSSNQSDAIFSVRETNLVLDGNYIPLTVAICQRPPTVNPTGTLDGGNIGSPAAIAAPNVISKAFNSNPFSQTDFTLLFTPASSGYLDSAEAIFVGSRGTWKVLPGNEEKIYSLEGYGLSLNGEQVNFITDSLQPPNSGKLEKINTSFGYNLNFQFNVGGEVYTASIPSTDLSRYWTKTPFNEALYWVYTRLSDNGILEFYISEFSEYNETNLLMGATLPENLSLEGNCQLNPDQTSMDFVTHDVTIQPAAAKVQTIPVDLLFVCALVII